MPVITTSNEKEKPPYVFQEYPKWVEKDGRKFIVQTHAEYLEHFPEQKPAGPPAEVVEVAAGDAPTEGNALLGGEPPQAVADPQPAPAPRKRSTQK